MGSYFRYVQKATLRQCMLHFDKIRINWADSNQSKKNLPNLFLVIFRFCVYEILRFIQKWFEMQFLQNFTIVFFLRKNNSYNCYSSCFGFFKHFSSKLSELPLHSREYTASVVIFSSGHVKNFLLLKNWVSSVRIFPSKII